MSAPPSWRRPDRPAPLDPGAGTAATTGSNNVYLGGEPLIILGPEHAATVAASGWSKDDLRRAVWQAARVPLSRFSAENLERFRAITPERFANQPPDTQVPICAAPTTS